ncbi:MAG: ABC transporter permease subunit [Gammaproteobacteria bacterium]|nr:ABC transporter permease subunit [Gammaproteobacteria bacterium]
MSFKIDRGTLQWLGVITLTLLCIAYQNQWSWMKVFPETWQLPFSNLLNAIMDWMIAYLGWFFRAIAWLLEWPIKAVRWILQTLPWGVTGFLICVVAFAASGWRLALFSLLTILYMVVFGYWSESMNTLSLVAISVPFAILSGFIFGVWGFYSPRAERFIMPMLDMLQTVPVFAYLLPILLLFGFGTVVGLVASVLYSFPPMVRNTIVGLRNVPSEVIESGLMSGASPKQLFWQVRVPSALQQLLLGVNQATMASLSMVIIASIIGGTEDIGWEVLSTIRKAQFGESLLAGMVIALMAMVIDRVTHGLAARPEYNPAQARGLNRYRYWIISAIGATLIYALSPFMGWLREWPASWEINPARAMNDALTYVVANFRSEIDSIKEFAFFYLMLPTKIGLQQAVSPFTWGFELTQTHKIIYVICVTVIAMLFAFRRGNNAAIAFLLLAILIYFGITNMAWPALMLISTYAAWRIGGIKLALGTFLGLGFIVVTGNWPQAMLSVYLCAIGVLISFVFGTAIGIWASTNDSVSAIVRPINDTLQTMPLFVILIPFVMIFKIGDFTALLAIIAYSFVPAIRYAEHGLRNLPDEVIEAARMIGCTKRQMLWQVKIPLALPIMMLGLNQTIMFGIAMLVITALVGTNGLEQTVYIGLSDGNFGVGMTAGLCMAVIAIIADRTTQAWSRNRSAELGIDTEFA